MSIEKMSGGSSEKEKDQETQELQQKLEHYLSIFCGYAERPEEILREANDRQIKLDVEAAIKQGFKKTLSGSSPEPDNLDLIIEFSKKHQITIDLTQPDILETIVDSYAVMLSGTLLSRATALQKFIERNHLQIDKDLVFKKAFIMSLQRGNGRRANHLIIKATREKRQIDFSDQEINNAFRQGLKTVLGKGEAEEANRFISFAEKAAITLEINKPEFVDAMQQGLKKRLSEMHLGPGIVSFVEQMIKLMRKYKILINFQDPAIVSAVKEVLQKSQGSSSRFPTNLQMFTAQPYIEEFIGKHKINIDR